MRTRPTAMAALAVLVAAVCAWSADAAERARTSPTNLYRQAMANFSQRLYDVAAADFAEFVDAYPSRRRAGQAALLLAESNAHLGRYAEASKALDWLAESRWSRRHEADLAYWRAQIALRTGHTADALEAFAAFLGEYPKHERVPYARLGVGQARLAAGELDEAVAVFDAIMAAAPAMQPLEAHQAEALFLAALGKARCLIRRDAVADARTLVLGAMEKLEARADARGEAFLVLGEASYRLGKAAEALEYYKQAFVENRIYPWYPEALYGIAWCHLELKQYAETRQVLTALAADYPDDATALKTKLTLAKLDLLEGHAEQAADALRALVDAEPPGPVAEEATSLIPEALLAAGRVDEADAAYESFLAATPESRFVPNATYGLAIARLRLGKRDEAITLLEAVIQHGGEPLVEQAHRRLGEALFAAGDYERAAAHYQALLERESPLADADALLFRLAWCHHKMADAGQQPYDNAIALFRQLIEKHAGSPLADNAQYRIAGALYRQGRYDKALDEYQAFAQRFPESELADRAAYQTGVCHYNLGDYYPALLAYQSVIEKFPDSALVHRAAYEIGWCHYMLGKGTEAFEHFTDYITRYPDSPLTPEVVFWLGEHHYNRAEYDKALERFAQLAADYPEHALVAAALYWAGRSCLNLGRHDEARDSFSAVLAHHAESDFAPDARYQTAVSHLEQADYEAALKALAPLATEESARYLASKVQWRTADCYLALGRVEEARPLYEALVENARDETVRAWAQVGLGRCHQADADYGRAIRHFMAVASDYPIEREVVGRAMVEAGHCYEALGKRNEALIVYASVVRKKLPGKAEAEARMKELRKKSFRFFNQTPVQADVPDKSE